MTYRRFEFVTSKMGTVRWKDSIAATTLSPKIRHYSKTFALTDNQR